MYYITQMKQREMKCLKNYSSDHFHFLAGFSCTDFARIHHRIGHLKARVSSIPLQTLTWPIFSPNIFRLGSLEVSAFITHQRGKHLGKTQDRVLDVVRDCAQLCLALVVHDEDTELRACGLPLGFGKSLYLTLDVLLQLSDRVSVRIAQQGTRRAIDDIASLKRFA